jgi:hypothetical protein
MNKSREFENVLNECLEHLLVGGETIERCLGLFPEHADRLKPLLETALTTKRATDIQPHPEFRERAKYQFQAALRAMEGKKSRSFFWGWRPRWAVAVASVLVILLAGSGTVVVASGSMPDDFLYPVKLATEQVQLALTPSSLGKAEFYTQLADKRVLEIEHMADKGKSEQIESAVLRLDTYLIKVASLSTIEPARSDIALAPASKEAMLAEEAPALEPGAVAREAPEDEAKPVPKTTLTPEKAPVAKAPVAAEAQALSEEALDRGEVRVTVDRRTQLKAIVTQQAINNPARLRALLERVPAQIRPVLLRAIEVSESGYEKALESLD